MLELPNLVLGLYNNLLELHNIEIIYSTKTNHMNNNNWNYRTIFIIVIFGLLGLAIAYVNEFDYTGLDLLKFAVIIIIGSILVYYARKNESIEAEFPAEDERTLHLKYKVGYYAGQISFYIWLFIFIFNDKFPYDVEIILGGGLLLSALIIIITRFVIKRRLNV